MLGLLDSLNEAKGEWVDPGLRDDDEEGRELALKRAEVVARLD